MEVPSVGLIAEATVADSDTGKIENRRGFISPKKKAPLYAIPMPTAIADIPPKTTTKNCFMDTVYYMSLLPCETMIYIWTITDINIIKFHILLLGPSGGEDMVPE